MTGAGNGGPGAPGEDVSCAGATVGVNGGFGRTSGGMGAPGTVRLTFAGGDGSLGQGGGGGDDPNAFNGAGGGGYYGGGGGGDGCSAGGGGGAGSSFWIDGATKTSMSTDTTGKPKVVITPLAEDRWTAGANKAWSASSPKTTFVSTAATITCTTNTASGPSVGSGPDIGALTMNAPKFSNCKDSLGDRATVTTKSSGWTVSFISDSGNAKCPAGTTTRHWAATAS